MDSWERSERHCRRRFGWALEGLVGIIFADRRDVMTGAIDSVFVLVNASDSLTVPVRTDLLVDGGCQ